MRAVGARLAALIVAASLATGCAHRPVVYGLELGSVAVGAALVQIDPDDSEDDHVNTAPMRQTAITVGAVLLVAGLAGLVISASSDLSDARDERRRDDRAKAIADVSLAPLPELPGANPDAVRMTKQARRAVRDGQCEVAQRLGAQVHQIDERYYVLVFREDPPLRACL